MKHMMFSVMYFTHVASSMTFSQMLEIFAKTILSVVCHHSQQCMQHTLFAPLVERHPKMKLTDKGRRRTEDGWIAGAESDTLEEKSPITPPLPSSPKRAAGPPKGRWKGRSCEYPSVRASYVPTQRVICLKSFNQIYTKVLGTR